MLAEARQAVSLELLRSALLILTPILAAYAHGLHARLHPHPHAHTDDDSTPAPPRLAASYGSRPVMLRVGA